MMKLSDIKKIWSELDEERNVGGYVNHWKSISTNLFPRLPRFFVNDQNKGSRANQSIVHGHATLALRTAAAGMSGMADPNHRWMSLSTLDDQTSTAEGVATWLHTVSQRMYMFLSKADFYNHFIRHCKSLFAFGTAVTIMEEDYSGRVVNFTTPPIGSYWLGKDASNRHNMFFRVFKMSARQIVERFCKPNERGLRDMSNLSAAVKSAFQNSPGNQFEVMHGIVPNKKFNPVNPGKEMPFLSVYYENASADSEERFLKLSGYATFPALTTIWEANDEDCYGTDCPGMMALGDIQELYWTVKQGGKLISKSITPPMAGPSEMTNKPINHLPGAVTADESAATGSGQPRLRPLYEQRIPYEQLEKKMNDIKGIIDRTFYYDLFMLIASLDKAGVTATEIDSLREEKMVEVGPVYHSVAGMLRRLVDNMYYFMEAQGYIPDVPEVLAERQLKTELYSVLALAMNLSDLPIIERNINFSEAMLKIDPTYVPPFDTYQVGIEYARKSGLSGDKLLSSDQVASIKAQRAQEQMAAQQAATIPALAKSARDLASAKTGEPNALTELMESLGGGGQ